MAKFKDDKGVPIHNYFPFFCMNFAYYTFCLAN